MRSASAAFVLGLTALGGLLAPGGVTAAPSVAVSCSVALASGPDGDIASVQMLKESVLATAGLAAENLFVAVAIADNMPAKEAPIAPSVRGGARRLQTGTTSVRLTVLIDITYVDASGQRIQGSSSKDGDDPASALEEKGAALRANLDNGFGSGAFECLLNGGEKATCLDGGEAHPSSEAYTAVEGWEVGEPRINV